MIWALAHMIHAPIGKNVKAYMHRLTVNHSLKKLTHTHWLICNITQILSLDSSIDKWYICGYLQLSCGPFWPFFCFFFIKRSRNPHVRLCLGILGRGHSSYRSQWSRDHPLTCTKTIFGQKIGYFICWNHIMRWMKRSFIQNTAEKAPWRGFWTLCE